MDGKPMPHSATSEPSELGWAGTGVCALMEGDTGLLLFHYHLVSRQQGHRYQSLLPEEGTREKDLNRQKFHTGS